MNLDDKISDYQGKHKVSQSDLDVFALPQSAIFPSSLKILLLLQNN